MPSKNIEVMVNIYLRYHLQRTVEHQATGGLGPQTGRDKNIKAALLTMAAERVTGGVQGRSPREKGFYAVLGVGERGFSDDFMK